MIFNRVRNRTESSPSDVPCRLGQTENSPVSRETIKKVGAVAVEEVSVIETRRLHEIPTLHMAWATMGVETATTMTHSWNLAQPTGWVPETAILLVSAHSHRKDLFKKAKSKKAYRFYQLWKVPRTKSDEFEICQVCEEDVGSQQRDNATSRQNQQTLRCSS